MCVPPNNHQTLIYPPTIIRARHDSTPWLYLTGTVGTFICVQCLVLIYWGLLAVSKEVEKCVGMRASVRLLAHARTHSNKTPISHAHSPTLTYTRPRSPYKYARGGFSLPLENYCRRLHDLTLEFAQALGGDKQSFIPSYLDDAGREGEGEGDGRVEVVVVEKAG